MGRLHARTITLTVRSRLRQDLKSDTLAFYATSLLGT
jgi:hypothetical protein